MSPLAATLVRYLFGLPFALVYLAILWSLNDAVAPAPDATFALKILVAGILQIVATILMTRLFMTRNFAVGSVFIRCEILMTAVIGAIFFADPVPPLGCLAIVMSACGLVIVSIAKTGTPGNLWNNAAALGLGAGLAFSLTSLLIRSASLSLGVEPMLAAATTLVSMVGLQTVICVGRVWLRDAGEFVTILRRWRLSLFVGVTSIVGSAAWFTAFTLERAAYVKTLGQIELLITVLISILFFKELPNRKEFAGMTILVVGALLLLLAS
tara:strand:- start:517 stop:1320 length:804 start_codon:yes stop_codon:yes gene_type:complete